MTATNFNNLDYKALVFASLSFGQTPSASPEQDRTKNFGSSLKKYEEKKRRDSKNKQKSNNAKSDDEEDIIRVETDLVINDVLVANPKGNVILVLCNLSY